MITYDIRIALQLPFSLGNKHATLSVSCTLSPGALLSSLTEQQTQLLVIGRKFRYLHYLTYS